MPARRLSLPPGAGIRPAQQRHELIGSVSRLVPDGGEWTRTRLIVAISGWEEFTEGARYGGHEAPDR